MAPVGAFPLWGEVPQYINSKWQVRSYIARNIQLPLPLKLPAAVVQMTPGKPVYRDANGWLVSPFIWNQQPRRFPVGWRSLSLRNPDWRHEYRDEWIAKRKALGLPHEVIDPIWFQPLKGRTLYEVS